MSRTYKDMKIRVAGKRKKRPDARRLARVLIELAQAQEEVEAEQAGAPERRQPVDQADNAGTGR